VSTGKYATASPVPARATRHEIELLIEKYGGDRIIWDVGPNRPSANLIFEIQGWRIRYTLPLPTPDDAAFRFTATFRARSATAQREEYEKAVRSRWRALKLVIHANLEAVEVGIMTIAQAFLASVMLPGGETVAERIVPDLAEAAKTGHLPPLLPEPGRPGIAARAASVIQEDHDESE
jgi:hypothetical protein